MKTLRSLLASVLLLFALVVPVAAGGSSFDVCPNLDGFQSRVPGNYTVVILHDGGWACVPRK